MILPRRPSGTLQEVTSSISNGTARTRQGSHGPGKNIVRGGSSHLGWVIASGEKSVPGWENGLFQSEGYWYFYKSRFYIRVALHFHRHVLLGVNAESSPENYLRTS